MSSQRSLRPLGHVLVVGGCGFLGHHIVSLLVESSTQVSVLDLVTNRNRFPSVSYYDGDITSSESVSAILRQVKPQIVIHTASPIAGKTVGGAAAFYRKVNVDGTRCLLESAGQTGFVRAFVYTSSASIVHDNRSDLINADERLPILDSPEQTEIYSETKGVAERLVLAANRQYNNMLTGAIRPASMFGEGDVQMLPNILQMYKKGQTKVQLGQNRNLFDFTYVANTAYGHLLLAAKLLDTYEKNSKEIVLEDKDRVDGEAFNITNDHPYYFWDFSRAIWAAAGDKTKPEQVWSIPAPFILTVATLVEWIYWLIYWGKKQPNFTASRVRYTTITRTICIDKAKTRLGYAPIVSMEDGIERSVKWFQKEEESKGEGEKKTL
ncbi:MAG: erg26, C-3 sterol dehydrogenase [Sclerophora amabilis]|nr:MAG: erg26, C-3 sterol dehydrogenase [Sclerophora amabilis]